MGRALNLVSGRVTNPEVTITAMTACTGDSFTVRAFKEGSGAYLEEAWSFNETGGVVRIRSPRLHDAAQGIRLTVPREEPAPLMPFPAAQPLQIQDVLVVEESGGRAETDILSFLIYYEELPGAEANLMTWAEVKPRIRNFMGVECDLTSGATAGDYGGSQAMNRSFDNFKRNVNYAILGAITNRPTHSINITGPETGNLRIGIPGLGRTDVTAWWFAKLSEAYGTPHIPIINAANVGNTTVDMLSARRETAFVTTLILAELSGS